MGLPKVIFRPKPNIKMTEKTQKKCDLVWNTLCKNGSVCITDPSNTEHENIADTLKKDPHAFTRAHCDYYDSDGVPYKEFVEEMTKGGQDEK